MKTTEETKKRPLIRRTLLRFSAILIWLVVMLFATYQGLFLHAFLGMISLGVLTYFTVNQINARTKYYKKKQERYLSSYHAGEEYLKVFTAEN